MKNKLTILASLILLITSMSFATTYYVNDGSIAGDIYTLSVGNDANPGTAALPFATITYALSIASPSDVIIVDVGTYTEVVTINKSVTIQSAAGTWNTLTPTIITGGSALTISANSVTIDGFLFDSLTGSADVILSGGTDGIIISNNKFNNFERLAINTTGCSNWTITSNIFDNIIGSGTLGEACFFTSMATFAVTNNVFSNLGYAALQIEGPSSDAIITGNTFTTIGKQGINLGAINNAIISGNTMTACNTGGPNPGVDDRGAIRMYASGVTGIITISNNVITNTSGSSDGYAVVTKTGTGALGATVNVINNNFAGNEYGVKHNTTGTINAVDNWWGNASGPNHSSNTYTALNLSNQVAVSDNVTFVPWWNPITTAAPAGSLVGTSFAPLTNNDGPAEYYSNFADAILGTTAGNTITAAEGSFAEAVTINKNLRIDGSGAGTTATSFTLTAGAVLVSSTLITAPTVNVNQIGGAGAKVQDGVILSSSSGTLNVAAGTYSETVTVNKPLTIVGTGTPLVTGGFILSASPVTITGFDTSSTNVLDVVAGGSIQDALNIINSGGTINVAAGTYGAITINQPITLDGTGTVIINSGSPAITVNSTGVVISGLTFNFVTDEYAVDVTSGAYDVIIVDCDFLNTTFGKGVRNQGTGTVTATHNYWGDPNGPTVASNSCGTGCSAVNVSSGTLTYSPWYIDTPHTILMAAPVLVFPASSSVGVTVVPNFDWTSTSGGVPTYTIEIATDNSFTNVVYGPTAPSPSTATIYQLPDANALSNGVLYYWRIKETVGVATSCAVGSFTTISAAMPYLTNPSSGAILSGYTTTFAWYSGVAGVQYILQICKDNLFTTNYVDGYATLDFTPSPFYTNTYVTLNNTIFMQGVTYYWRVIAKTLSGTLISFSNTWQFSMPGLPEVVATYPTGNVTMYNNPPTLYWYPQGYNPKVTEYLVRYATTSVGCTGLAALNAADATDGLFTTTNINWFTTIPFALTSGQRYYWQVASYDGTTAIGSLNWSPIESFTVYGSSTFVVCYPSYPTAGTTVYTTTPTLYWFTNVYSPVMFYRVVIDDDSDIAIAPLYTSAVTIPSTSFTIPSGELTSGNTYYWGVQASFDNAAWGSLSAPASFTVTSTGTAASVATATPASPTSGLVIGVTNPTLSWYVYSADPLQFRVTWATDPAVTGGTFTTAVGTSGWMTSNSFVLGGLTAGATYYWQVQARLATTQVEGAWSTVAWFTITAGSASVVPLAGSPINGTPINTTNATLSWILPTQSTSVLKYDVQYSKNADFSDAETISNLDKPSVELKNLDKDAVYYWRAASFTNTGKKSDYSAPTSFATGAVVTDVEEQETIPTQFELSQNYPNPFNPTTKITYSLPQNSFVSIKVYDMLGREVRSLVNSEMLAGNHSIEWSGENNFGSKVASGTYIYRITAGNYISTKKMVLIK